MYTYRLDEIPPLVTGATAVRTPADLSPPPPPRPNPLAGMDPSSQDWTTLTKYPLKRHSYHIWKLILLASFLSMFFSITTQNSVIKIKKISHFVPILSHLLERVVQYAQELNANELLHSHY